MIYGYIRVSTNKQDVENQRFEINNFCERENMQVDKWIVDDGISGTVDYKKRKLGKMLHNVKKGDTIIACELSRLGRELFMVMELLRYCMDNGYKVWTIKDNYRLGDDIQSKVLAFAFGLSAEIERNLISQRTKEALARKKAEGVVLGRPRGQKNAPEKHPLYGKLEQITKLLDEGKPRTQIAKIYNVHRKTLNHYLQDNGIIPQRGSWLAQKTDAESV